MNFVDAVRISGIIRCKDKPSHIGSHGDGWVDVQSLIHPTGYQSVWGARPILWLTVEDILADDWEANRKYPRAE